MFMVLLDMKLSLGLTIKMLILVIILTMRKTILLIFLNLPRLIGKWSAEVEKIKYTGIYFLVKMN
jgi:hypothetical protein